MTKYIPIKEAQESAPYSNKWYLERIKERKFKAIGGGKGSKYLIDEKSFTDYLETLSQPMGV